MADPEQRSNTWVWRAITLAWVGVAGALSLALHRRGTHQDILAGNDRALRRACLSFPLPVMLQGVRVRRFRDERTGTQTLSYRVPAACALADVTTYYNEYLARHGFQPAPEALAERNSPEGSRLSHNLESGGRIISPACPLQPHRGRHPMASYNHGDGLRAALLAVHTEPLRGEYRTVIVSVRPSR